ncbi:MAG: hypothetical protein ACRD3F_01385 [Acidobacteriaceae bacterium]
MARSIAPWAEINAKIEKQDREIAQLSKHRYPETGRLSGVPGVGPVTALSYVC